MDSKKNQIRNDKRVPVNLVDDNANRKGLDVRHPVFASNASQVPFAEIATMAGQRGELDQESDQRPTVATATSSLTRVPTPASSFLLSSLHISNSNSNNNSRVTVTLLKTGAQSASWLDTSAKEQNYTVAKNRKKGL